MQLWQTSEVADRQHRQRVDNELPQTSVLRLPKSGTVDQFAWIASNGSS